MLGSTHGQDPFARGGRSSIDESAVSTAEADAAGFEHVDGVASQVVAAVIPSGVLTGWRQMFPDRVSRVASLFFLVAAIALSIYWTVYTVTDKWLESIRHPTQVITVENWPSLPALFGLAALYYENSPAATASIVRRNVVPYISSFGPSLSASEARINCSLTKLLYDVAFCMPMDTSGHSMFVAKPEDNLSGASGLDVDLHSHPAQFRSLADSFCIDLEVTTNITAYPQIYTAPAFGLISMDAVQTTAALEYIAAGIDSATSPRVSELVATLPHAVQYQYGTSTAIQFAATLNVDVNGKEHLVYKYTSSGSIQYSELGIYLNWLDLYNAEPTAEGKAKRLAQLTDPDLRFNFAQVCIAPNSQQYQVVREVLTYNALTFFSDAGGWLSIVTMVLGFLFPVIYSEYDARSLFVITLQTKWQARKRKKAKEALDKLEREQRRAARLEAAKTPASPSAASAHDVEVELHALPPAGANEATL